MKKISLALIAAIIATPAFSAAVGDTIAQNADASQTVQFGPGTGLQFAPFSITISKGVSMLTTDDTANAAVGVNSKHFLSEKVFGGSTSGGSVAQCDGTQAKNSNITGAVDDTKCNTSGS